MGEFIDPSDASIDGLIDWLSAKRRRDPGSALSDLLADHRLDEQRLVDIACIDLMQRRRMEHAVTVESYVDEFPCLRSKSRLLDLIDAEICIANELGERVDIDRYVDRFPECADQVRELLQLEVAQEAEMTSALIDVSEMEVSTGGAAASVSDEFSQSTNSGDFSIEVLPKDSASPRQITSLSEHPLDTPDWFVGGQCVASGPGRWLIRGRDSVRGIALALKVIELPALLSGGQCDQILDACEAAAKVVNPSWVLPRIAAIQQRHLGVIRPWVFARSWQPGAPAQEPRAQLRRLASVAFAIEAAHQRRATHGGIHLENLLIDHEGKLRIVDAGSSRMGLERWLHSSDVGANTDSFAPLAERKNIDTQDLIKLVAAASIEWEQDWSKDLVAEIRRIAIQYSEEACGQIGQTMMRYVDSATLQRDPGSANADSHSSWRRRLAQWLKQRD